MSSSVPDVNEPPHADPFIGRELAGRYRILAKLGEGAMGAVYLGEHLKIGRRDAIKILRSTHSADPEAVARFVRGTRNVSSIRHPNVCTVYDYSDTGDGMQFVAMELVSGESLKDTLTREGPLPLRRAIDIAAQIADALQAAHEVGVVHRDLKPANVMVARARDGSDIIKVVDFDIAKGGEKDGEEVTRLGFVVGTPEYMSPEQLIGEDLDGRSDLYSLGILLFRMLTGALPFAGQNTQEMMLQRLTGAPRRLEEAAPGTAFPPALQVALDRAMARRAGDRQASTAEFRREIVAAIGPIMNPAPAPRPVVAGGSDVPETRVGPPAPGASAASERRPLLIGLAVAALMLVVVLAWVMMNGVPDDPGVTTPPQVAVGSGDDLVPVANTGLPPEGPDGGGAQAGGSEATDDPGGVAGGGVAPAGPAGGNSTPIGEPAGGDASSAPGITLAEDANTVALRLFERLDASSPAVLVAITDTAAAIWSSQANSAADRALAAFVSGSAHLGLGSPANCALWLQRAVELNSQSMYTNLLDACQADGG